MRTDGLRQVPVVDHGDIVGVVTRADLAFEDDGGTVLAIVRATDQTSLSSGTVAGTPVGGNGSSSTPAARTNSALAALRLASTATSTLTR